MRQGVLSYNDGSSGCELLRVPLDVIVYRYGTVASTSVVTAVTRCVV